MPSFLTYIKPVPCWKSFPQNEHRLCFGICCFRSLVYLIFLASRSVSLSKRTSSTRTGPFTLREMIRPLSLPSSMRTLTWEISPVTPALPMTWITCAGVNAASSVVSLVVSLAVSFASLVVSFVVSFSAARSLISMLPSWCLQVLW